MNQRNSRFGTNNHSYLPKQCMKLVQVRVLHDDPKAKHTFTHSAIKHVWLRGTPLIFCLQIVYVLVCTCLTLNVRPHVGVCMQACQTQCVASFDVSRAAVTGRFMRQWQQARELTLRQDGASWMTALLCSRIPSTSPSGDTRGNQACVCYTEGEGGLMWSPHIGQFFTPQDKAEMKMRTVDSVLEDTVVCVYSGNLNAICFYRDGIVCGLWSF